MTASAIILLVAVAAGAGFAVGLWAATVHWCRIVAQLQSRLDALDASIAGDIRQLRIVKHGH